MCKYAYTISDTRALCVSRGSCDSRTPKLKRAELELFMVLRPSAALVRPNLLLFLTRERVPLSAPVGIEQVSKSVVTVLSMITRSYYNIYDNNLLLWPYIEHIVCVCSLQVTGMFSLYLRERIVRLSSQGHKPKAIVALLLQGFWVSLRGVYYVLKRYKTTGSVFDRPCSGHPQIISEEGQKLVDDWILNNDELTTTELMHKLAEQERRASTATVGRLRQSIPSVDCKGNSLLPINPRS